MTEYVLEILDGDRAGETIPLGTETVSMGRRDSNTVRLNDEKVSGQHAEVAFQDGGYVLRDLGSTNGTLLDGRRVEEMVLSSFDTFQVGRIHLQFREKGVEGLAIHRIDEERLAQGRPRRGMLGLLVAVLVLAAGGVWYTQLREPDAAAPVRSAGVSQRNPDNDLPAGVDDCELAAAWNLAAGGTGFELGEPPRSGDSCLHATGSDSATFALARSLDPIAVRGEESLVLSGFVRTAGDARVALRLQFSSSDGAGPTQRTGGAAAGSAEDAEHRVELAVPPGADEARVEVLALLPSPQAEVWVDDLSLVRGGSARPVNVGVAGGRLVGAGTALALRFGTETMFERVAPVDAPDGVVGFSDLGETVAVDAGEDVLAVRCGDGSGFTIHCDPRAVAGARLLEADGVFRARAGDFDVEASELLLGGGSARALLRVPQPSAVSGRRTDGGFAITWRNVDSFEIVLAFGEQRVAAQNILRDARRSVDEGAWGAALDRIRELTSRVPHDAATLGDALALRAELNAALNERLEEIAADYREAEFFRTRGGYQRVDAELRALLAEYGEQNVPEIDVVRARLGQIAEAVAALDAERAEGAVANLRALAGLFEQSGQSDLQALVTDYLQRNHPN